MDIEQKQNEHKIESTGEPLVKEYSESELSLKLNWVREKFVLKIIGAGILIIIALFLFLITAPKQSYRINMIRIHSGEPIPAIAKELQEKSIIRSATLLRVLFAVTRTADNVKSGDYVFEPHSNMLAVVRALVQGKYGEAYTWVTIPEGSTNSEISVIIDKRIANLSKQKFLELAKDKEGYLFPDTYNFSKLATEEEIIAKMNQTFLEKTRALRLQMSETEFKKAINIAAMLEDEAYDINDGRIISGVIQNRLNIKMRLQIDATVKYLTGRGSTDITRADLRHSSLYNTYRYEGLPPSPISNPGIEMITAAIYPQKSDYIYYLHAPDKNAYFAVTYEQHLKNKNKYLR